MVNCIKAISEMGSDMDRERAGSPPAASTKAIGAWTSALATAPSSASKAKFSIADLIKAASLAPTNTRMARRAEASRFSTPMGPITKADTTITNVMASECKSTLMATNTKAHGRKTCEMAVLG